MKKELTIEEKYELGRTKGAKTIHLLAIISKKKSTTVCNKKELKDLESFELDLGAVTCKRCVGSKTFRELFDFIAEGKPLPSDEKMETEKPKRGRPKKAAEPKPEKVEAEKPEKITEDLKTTHTLVFCACTKKQSPILTVVSDSMDNAKAKIEREFRRGENRIEKLRKWEEGGKAIVSRYVPNEMLKLILREDEKKMKSIVSKFDIRGQMQAIATSLSQIAKFQEDLVKITYSGLKNILKSVEMLSGEPEDEEVGAKPIPGRKIIERKAERKLFKR